MAPLCTDLAEEDAPPPMSPQEALAMRIRKVRSLDFGRLRKESLAHHSKQVASKFSNAAQNGGYPLRRRSAAKLSAVLRNDLPAENQTILLNNRMMRIPLTLGFLSMSLLALMTISNFALGMVNARVDIPTGDVIAPPFRVTDKPTLGLGTAAISAVTEALGPILPFTGGVDLRREEHWDTTQGWVHTATCMVNQVRDAFGFEPLDTSHSLLGAIPRGGAKRKERLSLQKIKPANHVAAISSSEPFVPIKEVATMTLSDLTAAFRYALESNADGFDEKNFFRHVQPRMHSILKSMEEAIAKSRGSDVLSAKRTLSGNPGDVDALHFSAAMRLFAEWRVVRQVPEGYKGFAVGMNLGLKDIVQNVAKIEKAAHEWIDYRRALLLLRGEWDEAQCPTSAPTSMKLEPDCELRSPTLRDLLEYEADRNIHQRLPRLKDKTAAMGLLWVRRQLDYQTALFANVVKVPSVYVTSTDAITAAYSEVYDKYHGWAVQKIFKYSFQSAPEVEEIYKFMNPHKLADVVENAAQVAFGESQQNVSDSRQEVLDKEDLNPLQQFGGHIATEWGKVVHGIGQIFNDENARQPSVSFAKTETVSDAVVDAIVTKAMTEDAHSHIMVYLGTVQGLLSELAALFDELNMDDPTKV